jgi:hypothetical protein
MQYDSSKFEKIEIVNKYKEKLSNAYTELEKKFKALRDEADVDCNDIDKLDLISEQNKNMKLYQKYITKYAEEKILLNKIKASHAEMRAELYDYYKFNWDKSTKLTETAVNTYVDAHTCYVVLNTYVELAKTMVEFLLNTIDIFKSRNYAIKSIIEVRKIELGLN